MAPEVKEMFAVGEGKQDVDGVLALWMGIDARLSPVIGRRGMAALYQRSVHIASADYPWLVKARVRGFHCDEFAELKRALVEQPDVQVSAASTRLLQVFCTLLEGLIGRTLSKRLLRLSYQIPPVNG